MPRLDIEPKFGAFLGQTDLHTRLVGAVSLSVDVISKETAMPAWLTPSYLLGGLELPDSVSILLQQSGEGLGGSQQVFYL